MGRLASPTVRGPVQRLLREQSIDSFRIELDGAFEFSHSLGMGIAYLHYAPRAEVESRQPWPE